MSMSTSSTMEGNKRDEKVSMIVANHYNNLEEKGLEARKESRIYYMRNFNNWIKSVVIGNTLEKIREKRGNDCKINVLDIGCGKGGDLLKYKIGRISHIICADIAETSLQQCRERYEEMLRNHQRNNRFNRNNNTIFTSQFIAGDCTRVRLKHKYDDPSLKFDCVSIQFSFHYCFESLSQAECMIRNASEALRTGGHFIGTTPDSYEIIRRLRESDKNTFGNDVYTITFDEKFCDSKTPIPLFGTKYDFHLEGVVNCPEFLVHFPTLVDICEKYDLKLLFRKRFEDYYTENSEIRENKMLLNRMNVLEPYPPSQYKQLMGNIEKDYDHAKSYINQLSDGNERIQIGTLSASEWDAISLYIVFAFEKMPPKEVSESSTKRQKI